MEEKKIIVLNELKSYRGTTGYWGHLYFVLNDYFNGIGIVISILAPFGFAALLYLPNNNLDIINFWFMIITGIGVILSVIRILFEFQKRSKFILKQKIDADEVYFLLDTDEITVKTAIYRFNKIRRKDFTDIEV